MNNDIVDLASDTCSFLCEKKSLNRVRYASTLDAAVSYF